MALWINDGLHEATQGIRSFCWWDSLTWQDGAI